ncbi:regulator [Carboxylicivirga sediminis]|uniref:Regulator n=1 Tax=Carboxylicivirga sediminis TaxID=2006564 RepID=A0A941F6Q5_9BACT|nr:triple tyrosine motif-containing protein [Carboxylicivirga sediminis]MBR8536978.1 regulator [Carboxylicivirga sediminis]
MNRALFLVLTLLVSVTIQGQTFGIPEVEYFNRRQYDGATQNWQVSQSDNDLIYVANNKGLLEFDGNRWQRYGKFITGAVRSVKCIGKRVYAGAHNDFGYFEYDSLQQFRFVSLATNDSLRSLGDVWNIYLWNERIVLHTEKALVIIKDDYVVSVVPNLSRFVSCFLANEMLLVYDEQNGLMELRGNEVFPLVNGDFFADKYITSIIPLSKSKLLITTMNNGAFTWDMTAIEKWKGSVNSLLAEANVFCAVRYNDETMLFGTIQKGLLVTNMSGELLLHIGKDKGLKNNTVLGLFVDNQGAVWCGLDNGIARISLNSSISFLAGYYNIGTGYVQQKYEGDWYFGTNQGLYKIDQKRFEDPLKERTHFIKISGTEGQVWSLYHDDENILCGHNLGVYEVIGEKSRSITPPSVNGVWKFLPIPGHSDKLICGTYEGLIILSKENGRWKFKTKLEGFDKPSRFMDWDEQGRLWVADGYDTAYRLSFSSDYQSLLKTAVYGPTHFKQSVSVKVTKIAQKIVIVGDKGLFCLNEIGVIEPYKKLDAFFKASLYPSQIIEDGLKNLWLFYPEHVELLQYTDADNYKNIILPFIPLKNKLVSSFESVCVPDSSHVFFGIEDGFAHYYLHSYINFRKPFKVHIRSFKGRGDSLAYTYFQNGSSEADASNDLVYKYKNNLFEVEYAAAFFGDDNIEYATFLSSLDETYTEWTPENKRQFSKLREGEYLFAVKARNSYGIESIPHTISFRVLPPWYRTFYAKLAYVLLCLIVLLGTVGIINKRIEINRQKEKLKAKDFYKKKEEQLTNEALKAEQEVIKMRNEKLRSEMQFKEQELASLTVHIVQKNDLLSELQGQLKRIKRIKGQDESERKIESLIQKIGKDIDNESNWQLFERQFEQVHQTFINKLVERHMELTDKEKKLCAYIKMGMASKEIASLMNISTRSVENNRYKLRQKLGLKTGDDLSEYIASIG